MQLGTTKTPVVGGGWQFPPAVVIFQAWSVPGPGPGPSRVVPRPHLVTWWCRPPPLPKSKSPPPRWSSPVKFSKQQSHQKPMRCIQGSRSIAMVRTRLGTLLSTGGPRRWSHPPPVPRSPRLTTSSAKIKPSPCQSKLIIFT